MSPRHTRKLFLRNRLSKSKRRHCWNSSMLGNKISANYSLFLFYFLTSLSKATYARSSNVEDVEDNCIWFSGFNPEEKLGKVNEIYYFSIMSRSGYRVVLDPGLVTPYVLCRDHQACSRNFFKM